MLKISTRGHEMPASPIRKLVPFAEAAKKRGTKVFHLNIGQPDIETPRVCIDAVKNCDVHILAYSHSAGNESYRKKLVEYYSKNNINNPNLNRKRSIKLEKYYLNKFVNTHIFTYVHISF